MGIIKETSSGALHGRTYSGSYANWYCVGRTADAEKPKDARIKSGKYIKSKENKVESEDR